jgi:hypothetical protein
MAGSGKIRFRQGAKGYWYTGTYAKLLQRGMKRILPKMTICVQLICSKGPDIPDARGLFTQIYPRDF